MTRWPMIPAVNVPDELVSQALGVLQGVSREMVIRELQRTVSTDNIVDQTHPHSLYKQTQLIHTHTLKCTHSYMHRHSHTLTHTHIQNLDVNQAVNNLLSREDDDADGSHDEGNSGFLASGGNGSTHQVCLW